MLTPAQIEQTRREVRRLRIYTQQLRRLQLYYKDKANQLEEENKGLQQEVNRLHKQEEKLKEELY